MSDHQKETAFLRQCIGYDDTGERHRLEEKITQIQRDERIVRRAVWLMAMLAALAMAGLGYASVFMEENPTNVSQWTMLMPVKALCALGAGSLICLFVFLGLAMVFRKELDQRREDCRRLALKVLESRIGQPSTGAVNGQELTSHDQQARGSAEAENGQAELDLFLKRRCAEPLAVSAEHATRPPSP